MGGTTSLLFEPFGRKTRNVMTSYTVKVLVLYSAPPLGPESGPITSALARKGLKKTADPGGGGRG